MYVNSTWPFFHKQKPVYNRPMPQGYLTVREVATRLGVSRQRVYDLIAAGRLEAEKVGRDYLISEYAIRNIRPGKTRTGRPKK